MCSTISRSISSLRNVGLPIFLPRSGSINFFPITPIATTSPTAHLSSWHKRAAFLPAEQRSKAYEPKLNASKVRFCSAATAAAGETSTPPTVDSLALEVKRVTELLEEERKKAADFQDKYMRALAENQNTIARMRKQVDDAKVFGVQSLVKDLLEFSDVLNSALESTPKEEVSESNVHLKNLHVGLTMVASSLQKVFKKYGVEIIDPLGEKFNPNFHEALFQQEVENKTAGTIVAVSKVGYKLSDRVVRPALVGVAK